MNRKGLRGRVLQLAMGVCFVLGVFLVYTAAFHLMNDVRPLSLSQRLAAGGGLDRLFGGVGYVVMGLALGAILDMAKELELIA